MIILLTAALALLLHVLLGWPWVVLAALVAGVLKGRWGWAHGALGVGLSWTILLMQRLLETPAETGRVLEIMGTLFQGRSAGFVVLASLFIGLLIGALGGVIGTQLRLLVRPLSDNATFRKNPSDYR